MKWTEDPRGLAVVILALGIALSTIILAVSVVVDQEPSDPSRLMVAAVIIAVAVGAVAVYIGQGPRRRETGPPVLPAPRRPSELPEEP